VYYNAGYTLLNFFIGIDYIYLLEGLFSLGTFFKANVQTAVARGSQNGGSMPKKWLIILTFNLCRCNYPPDCESERTGYETLCLLPRPEPQIVAMSGTDEQRDR
jgi:hypothetical protein